MVLGQTNIEIDSTNVIMNHVNGNEVILITGKGVTPNVKHFIFKSDFEKIGRNCGIYRARIKNNLVDFYFK